MADTAQDPAYLAYLRALGFNESTDRATADDQTASVQRQAAMSIPEIAYQGDVTRQGIDTGYEASGLYSSGDHLLKLAQQAHNQGYQTGQATIGAADQIAAIQRTLANQMLDLNRQRTEAALGGY